jgi:integral membrane protein
MQKRFLPLFRLLGFLEGFSFLLLIGIAMPLKYAFDMPLAVRYTGLAHGLLFILYGVSALALAIQDRWFFKHLLLAGMAALMPFGPFAFDKWVLPKTKSGIKYKSL